jgi:hypothetical protein
LWSEGHHRFSPPHANLELLSICFKCTNSAGSSTSGNFVDMELH